MAAEFRDKDNVVWTIALTVPSMSRIKRESGGRFDLFDATSPCDGRELCQVIDDDTRLDVFWDLLWLLVEPQATKAKVSCEQFAESMASVEGMLLARKQFRKEWRDFFQTVQRQDLVLLLDKQAKADELAHLKLKQLMDDPSLSRRVDDKMAAAVEEATKKWSGDLSALLEPTPTAGPGVSST